MIRRVVVPVVASPGSEVRLDVAVVEPDGAEPTAGSRRWNLADRISTGLLPAELRSMPLPGPSRVWARLSGWEGRKRVTNFAVVGSFDLGVDPAISEVELLVDDGGGIVTWIPVAGTEEIRIRWSITNEDEGPSWNSPEVVAPTPSAFAVPQIPAMGERVHVELTPLADSGSIEGTPVVRSDVRDLDVGTATEPRHWTFTAQGHPVRASSFAVVTGAGLTIPDDWILRADALPVRSLDLDIVRTSP